MMPTTRPYPLPGPPQTIEDAQLLAAEAVKALWSGEIEPKVGREISVMVNAFVKATQTVTRLNEMRRTIRQLQLERKAQTQKEE